jgi:hypothetical protein
MSTLLPLIPESPIWYIFKNRQGEAEATFRRINRSQPDYDPSADMAQANDARRISKQNTEFSSWKSLVTDPVERRKMIYSAGAMFSQQVCGILFFYVYGVVFIQAIGVANPFLVQIVINVMQIVAMGLSVLVANKTRRRVNFMVTSIMMLIAFLVIGAISTMHLLTTASQ